jgi:hypothetical protein
LNIPVTAITIGIFLLPFAISFADRSSPHWHRHRVDEVLVLAASTDTLRSTSAR